jgi:hypothetical protein
MGAMEHDVRCTLTELRNVRRRCGRQSLETDDWPVINALLDKEIGRAERRRAKVLAKAAASESAGEVTGPTTDAEVADGEEDEHSRADAGPSGAGKNEGGARGDSSSGASHCADGSTAAEPDARRRGHGRNGAGAYEGAKHYVHALLAGILGALCKACGVGRMSRYRPKLIVVVKGQPLQRSPKMTRLRSREMTRTEFSTRAVLGPGQRPRRTGDALHRPVIATQPLGTVGVKGRAARRAQRARH